MKFLVTGAAGFIGSTVIDRLLQKGHSVVGVDNFSTGRREFLTAALTSKQFRMAELDLLKPEALLAVVTEDIDWVIHLAANADVRDGLKHPRKDLEQNTIVTSNVLEAMRAKKIKRMAFSSTGSVYGEAATIPTPENCPFPVQTSLYGASKLAAEGMMAAYAEGYGMQSVVFRFVSILGERYTHGHVYDFVKQLKEHPDRLTILGDGKQRKSYLYTQDCVDAIERIVTAPFKAGFDVFNLGTDEYVTVNESVAVICETLQVKPRLEYTGGDRGWVGDNPFIFLDCARMRATGWKPQVSIRDAVRRTVHYLKGQSA